MATPENHHQSGTGRYSKRRLGIRPTHRPCMMAALDLFRPTTSISISSWWFILDGSLARSKVQFPAFIQARKRNFKGLFCRGPNAREAAIVNDLKWMARKPCATPLRYWPGFQIKPHRWIPAKSSAKMPKAGWTRLWRMLKHQEPTAANVILIGPPGRKTGGAAILPFWSARQRGNHQTTLFRRFHHSCIRFPSAYTISDVAPVGGGLRSLPEISSGQNGVFFLMSSWIQNDRLEVMRQPWKSDRTISRAKVIDYPASFLSWLRRWILSPLWLPQPPRQRMHLAARRGKTLRYPRFPGPLLDRIDSHVEVTPVSYVQELTNSKRQNWTAAIYALGCKCSPGTAWALQRHVGCVLQTHKMPGRMVHEVVQTGCCRTYAAENGDGTAATFCAGVWPDFRCGLHGGRI